MRFHPYAEIFPLLEGENFNDLVADIQQHGLRESIVELDSMILDGRNRYRACLEAGIEIKTKKYTGSDPLGYVLSANLHRRHLNESQRAMVAAELANMSQHDNQHTRGPVNLPDQPTISQPDAARMVGVSDRSVRSAKVVKDNAAPELVERVRRGEVAVSLAAKVAKLSKAEQHNLKDADEGRLRNAVKQSRRSDREVELAEATEKASKALGTKLYSVIYADPPWRFEPYSRETGMDRAADNHYPTMTLERIYAMKVPAAKDAVLFLWATAPMMPQALEVMAAWGFEYKSQCIWGKDQDGTGYWYRNKHELLLTGTRGKIPAPAPGDQYSSLIMAKAGRHSEKPELFAEMICELFPHLERLELFARKPRLGWDIWGNENSS